MDENDDSTPEAEPLAKTRTRRSNAGARMHEMMFNAEDDEMLAQAYGIIKAEDESSDDEEYIPKDLEKQNDKAGREEDDDDLGDEDADGDSRTSNSGDSEDESDEDDEEDDDEDEEDVGAQEENDDGINDTSDHAKYEIKRESRPVKLRLKETKVHVKIENGTSPQTGSPTKSAYSACAGICSVCLGDQSDEDDEIIECDSCGVTVHESCYGVSGEDGGEEEDSPVHSMVSCESTEPWFCEPCRRSVLNPYCELCPNTGGIFKETDTGRWVHMVCALYTRGVTFNNIANLTEVSLFELNYALYGSKACTICEDRRLARSGVCIGCDAGLCKTFFHPTCAQKEGLLFESPTDEVDPYFAQCKQHADKSTIRRKKKTCVALFARLRRVQNLDNKPERIKSKLEEITQQQDPCLTRWTVDHRPPIPQRVGRMLLTSPSLIIRLTKKSELLGLDPTSSFMTIQDEMEMARQKWHIPPAFNLEFVAYCRDRTTRMIAMNKKNSELLSQNNILKKEESNLRQRYNSFKDVAAQLRAENQEIIEKIEIIQTSITQATGKQFILPQQIETLIEQSKKTKTKTPSKSSTYSCGKCGTTKDQHLLALCDTCKCYVHVYCLDPPLSRVPKKTKFGGWQCSDCSEKDTGETEEEQGPVGKRSRPRRQS